MVFEKLREIICDYFEIDEEEVSLDSSFLMEFGFDELDMADLSMDVEDVFEVEVTEDDLDKIETVGDFVAFIENNKK